MYSYINGIIKEIKPRFITIETNGIGYMISVSNPYAFKLNDELKIYIYQYVREDNITLYGFKTYEEKELFIRLLQVKGIGPKSALSILAGDSSTTLEAISSGNSNYFKKFPGIGQKASQQIILDLKGKVELSNVYNNNPEVVEVLQTLGYSQKEINKVLPKLDLSKETSDLVKEALRELSK